MFVLYADKTQLTVRQKEPVTSGSVNVYPVRFEFSPDWDGMTKIACFRSGAQTVTELLDGTGECVIPWEVTDPDDKDKTLYAGLYGTRNGNVVLPTVWARLGIISEGVSGCGAGSRPPTPELWRQELARKGDRLAYTSDGDLGLYAGDKLLSAVPVSGGGGPAYGIGHGLQIVAGDLTVVTTDNFTGDNTLPMTAAGVQATVGNIETLLGTI